MQSVPGQRKYDGGVGAWLAVKQGPLEITNAPRSSVGSLYTHHVCFFMIFNHPLDFQSHTIHTTQMGLLVSLSIQLQFKISETTDNVEGRNVTLCPGRISPTDIFFLAGRQWPAELSALCQVRTHASPGVRKLRTSQCHQGRPNNFISITYNYVSMSIKWNIILYLLQRPQQIPELSLRNLDLPSDLGNAEIFESIQYSSISNFLKNLNLNINISNR